MEVSFPDLVRDGKEHGPPSQADVGCCRTMVQGELEVVSSHKLLVQHFFLVPLMISSKDCDNTTLESKILRNATNDLLMKINMMTKF